MSDPMVSHIVPTWNRPERHRALYENFVASRYSLKELLIADEGKTPSAFFGHLRDPRVKYWHTPVRQTIGGKRNFLLSQAQGDVIQHQDDDDWYSPQYTHIMLRRMGDADLVKLAVFNILNERDGTKWQWDTRISGGPQVLMSKHFRGVCIAVPGMNTSTDGIKWGFGFSYLYKGDKARQAAFPEMNLREDIEFVKRMRLVSATMVQVEDCPNLVWHTVHDLSTSACFPQKRLDGPMPVPVANYVAGPTIGAILGGVLGGPAGAMVGGMLAGLGTHVHVRGLRT